MTKKPEVIKGYKGFNKDLKCNDYQYKIGSTEKFNGEVKICKSGFHFCEHPLDVFNYYNPANSKFAEVEGTGSIDRENTDTKICCSEITIKAEINFQAMIEAAVKFVFDRAKWTKKNTVSKEREASKATGDSGAASATGDRGAASATGYSGAASATGDRGAASATGYRGAASATGANGIASSLGIYGKAKGSIGVWLVLSEWIEDKNEKYGWKRSDVKCVKVDGEKIKADQFYMLKNGEFLEVE